MKINPQSQATLQEIWNILREVSKNQKETDRKMQETDKQLRRLNNLFTGQWGKLMESLVDGGLVQLLQNRNIQIKRTLKNMKLEFKGERFEFDIIAVNGPDIVVTEVKTTLKTSDVDYFLKKLSRFKDFAPEYKDKRILGATAFLKANQSSDVYAEKSGLFVIRAVGGGASIVNKKNFKPKSF